MSDLMDPRDQPHARIIMRVYGGSITVPLEDGERLSQILQLVPPPRSFICPTIWGGTITLVVEDIGGVELYPQQAMDTVNALNRRERELRELELNSRTKMAGALDKIADAEQGGNQWKEG